MPEATMTDPVEVPVSEEPLPAFEVPSLGTPDEEEIELRLFCGRVAAGCTRGGMEPEEVLEQARRLHDWIAERDRDAARKAMEVCAELYKGQAARFLIQQAGLFYDYATSPLEPEPEPEPQSEPEPTESETETQVETDTQSNASEPSNAGEGSEAPATPPQPKPVDPHESTARKPQGRGRKKPGAQGQAQKQAPA